MFNRVPHALALAVTLTACTTIPTRVISDEAGSPGGAVHLTQSSAYGSIRFYAAVRVYSGVDLASIMTTPGQCTFIPVRHRAQQSLGNVTVTKGMTTLAMLAPTQSDEYETVGSEKAPLSWSPGDVLSVKAQAGATPVLSASVTAPEPIENITPADLPNWEPRPVPRDSDLHVTWKAGHGTAMEISLTDVRVGPEQGASLICITRDSGAFTIPSKAVAHFSPGRATLGLVRLNVNMQEANKTRVAVLGGYQHQMDVFLTP